MRPILRRLTPSFFRCARRPAWTLGGLLALLLLTLPVVMAGQMDADTLLHKEEGLPSIQSVTVGRVWIHTPDYYRQVIETNAPKLAGPVTHEQFASIDATAMAYLQLEQYDDALRVLALKAAIDPNDYALEANRSIVHARHALAGPPEVFSAEMDAAIADARLAEAHSGDPFHRDGMYLRALLWLTEVHATPALRERSCLLGYNLLERLAIGREKDRLAKVGRNDPLTPADLAALLGEDPNFLDALVALVSIDSLAVPDGLMTLGKIADLLGDTESAYFAFTRLQEMSAPYDHDGLENRLQLLLAHAHTTVRIGPGREVAIPLDHDGLSALNEQCFNRYLRARREAQAFSSAFDEFERQQLAKKPFIGSRKMLESFYRQQLPAAATPAVDTARELPEDDDPLTPTPFEPVTFLLEVAIWVPVALLLAGLILFSVRLLRRYETLAGRS